MTLKYVAKSVVFLFVFAEFLACSTSYVFAQNSHPAYLHALADLRDARAHLERPDHGALRHEENQALLEINYAIAEIKKAAIDDGKNPNAHTPVDAQLDWPGRLHGALALLDKAHNDIESHEDDAFASGLKQRALDHINKARREVQEAIRIVLSQS